MNAQESFTSLSITQNQLIEAFITVKQVRRGNLSVRYVLRRYLKYCQQSGVGTNRLSAESYQEHSLESHDSIIQRFVAFYEEIGHPILLFRPDGAVWWDKAESLARTFIRGASFLPRDGHQDRWRTVIVHFVRYGVEQERRAFPPDEHPLVGYAACFDRYTRHEFFYPKHVTVDELLQALGIWAEWLIRYADWMKLSEPVLEQIRLLSRVVIQLQAARAGAPPTTG